MKLLYKLSLISALVAVFGFAHTASAATFAVGNPNGAGSVYVSAQLDKSVYAPGEEIRVNAQMYSQSPVVNQLSLQGGANGTVVNILNQLIANGQSTPLVYTRIGAAQNTPGTYNASFSGGYNVSPVSVYALAGEDGHGSASSTTCLIRTVINDGIPVNQDIEAVVVVSGRGFPFGSPYQPSNPGNGLVQGDLGVVVTRISAGQTQSAIQTSLDGLYDPRVPGSQNGSFFCYPGETYDARIIDIWPSQINERTVVGQ